MTKPILPVTVFAPVSRAFDVNRMPAEAGPFTHEAIGMLSAPIEVVGVEPQVSRVQTEVESHGGSFGFFFRSYEKDGGEAGQMLGYRAVFPTVKAAKGMPGFIPLFMA